MNLVFLILAYFAGCMTGVVLMSLCAASANADRAEETSRK